MDQEYQQETYWPDIWAYLKRPTYLQKESMANKKMFLLNMLLLIFLCNFVQIILSIPTLQVLDSGAKIKELVQEIYSQSGSYGLFALNIVLLLAVFPAILEELLFRLPLQLRPLYFSINGNELCISAAQQLWSWFAFFAFYAYMVIGLALNPAWLVVVLVFGVTVYVWKNLDASGHMHAGFPMFFIILGLIFGFVHLGNFDMGDDSLSFLVIYGLIVYCLGRTALGLVLAYVRMRVGFPYAMLLHFCNNFIISLLLIASPQYVMGT